MKTCPDDRLKEAYLHLKDLELGLLLAGLMVLAKDTADFININGLSDEATERFRSSYLDMLNYDRYYWAKFGAGLHLSLEEAGLPFGFAQRASHCDFDLGDLEDPAIEYEWTRAPGWHFFTTYTSEIREDILRDTDLEKLKGSFCDTEDPYERFAALTEKLAKTRDFGSAFWYPLMLYVILLLHKTDFRTLV